MVQSAVLVKHDKNVHMLFGSKHESFDHKTLQSAQYTPAELLRVPPFCTISHIAHLQQLLFLKQVHSATGTIISSGTSLAKTFMREGDYLYTQNSLIGLGVVTADCVPIILYAHKPRIICIIHAGWRGTVAHIASKALYNLCATFKCRSQDIKVVIGPYARACCYEIKNDVIKKLYPLTHKNESSLRRVGDRTFFDAGLLNQQLLIQHGVAPEHINIATRACTICSEQYCSFRAHGNTMRQFSIVFLSS